MNSEELRNISLGRNDESTRNNLYKVLLTLAEHLALAQVGGREGSAGIGDLLTVEGHAALLDGLTGLGLGLGKACLHQHGGHVAAAVHVEALR